MESSWMSTKTLGAKSKPFEWKYDKKSGLYIHRVFSGSQSNTVVFSESV